jgi:Ca-activated chloride channel family protein
LLRGLDLMKGRKNPHEVSSVLLLTDGLANHGITSVDEMTRQMDKKNVKGCTVFTFGVGQDHDGKMLRTLAENGHGLYYFLKDPENIPVSFADCLGGLSSFVAQNISLKISGNEGVKILKSLNPKYKLTQGGPLPSNQITLEIGDIYSEEERDIIIMIKVPKFKREAEGSIEQICAQFTLEFFNILTTQSETHQVDVIIQRPEKLSGSQQPNEALDKQRNRIQVAEAMDEARNRADKGELDEAKKLLEKTKEKVNSSSTGKDEYCQKLSSQLDDCIQDMRSTEQYSSEGSKKMESSVQSHYLQRSTVETAMYETSSKVAYKSKAKKSLF